MESVINYTIQLPLYLLIILNTIEKNHCLSTVHSITLQSTYIVHYVQYVCIHLTVRSIIPAKLVRMHQILIPLINILIEIIM